MVHMPGMIPCNYFCSAARCTKQNAAADQTITAAVLSMRHTKKNLRISVPPCKQNTFGSRQIVHCSRMMVQSTVTLRQASSKAGGKSGWGSEVSSSRKEGWGVRPRRAFSSTGSQATTRCTFFRHSHSPACTLASYAHADQRTHQHSLSCKANTGCCTKTFTRVVTKYQAQSHNYYHHAPCRSLCLHVCVAFPSDNL
jgi:hypothetical protein